MRADRTAPLGGAQDERGRERGRRGRGAAARATAAAALGAAALLAPSAALADPDAEGTPAATPDAPAAQAGPDAAASPGHRGPKPPSPEADALIVLDPRRDVGGRDVPEHFVGFSIEWSLIERYMGSAARPAFVNLLRNLGTGVLRIGGSSQDQLPFDPAAPDSNRVITPEDLRAIRATLEAADTAGADAVAPSWGAILGTAMAPPSRTRPFVGPEHALRFRTDGVDAVFSGEARRALAGIELGNEPDLSYGSNPDRYLADLALYQQAGATTGTGVVAPNTSEPIAPWASIAARTVPLRFFWAWPKVLDATAPLALDQQGAFGAFATDHFYPFSRTCATDPYRCPSIPTLLAEDRMDNLEFEIATHAGEAARHGLGYRVEELNTASGRGAHGVSDVAASATWALDALFSAACPDPPDAPGTNRDCATGAVGLNFHNAEVRLFSVPEEGNGYYNAINFDPSDAAGAPAAAPEYYAVLLFAGLAQGQRDLRPVEVAPRDPDGARVKAWRTDGAGGQRRLFLLNKGATAATVDVDVPGGRYEVDRMTPYDPTGDGGGLDAPEVRIDGRAVAADGVWPGFAPTTGRIRAGSLSLSLAPGEAAVVTLHGDGDGDGDGDAAEAEDADAAAQ